MQRTSRRVWRVYTRHADIRDNHDSDESECVITNDWDGERGERDEDDE